MVELANFIGEIMAELKAGSTYQYTRPDGCVDEFTCICTMVRRGKKFGWIQRFGLAREMVTDEHEMIKASKELLPPAPPAPKPAPKKTVTRKKTAAKKESSSASK
jgi:hypothetical protein